MAKRQRTSRARRSRKARRRSSGPGAWLAVIRPVKKLARNMQVGGIDVIEKFAFPALAATGGLLASQWLSGKVGPSHFPTTDPRLIAAGASSLVAFGAYTLGENFGLSPETQMTIAAGAGITGVLPWIPPAMLTSRLAPSQAPLSGYYQRSMLGGLMVDVSHAGSPYKGMFGLGSDPANQAAVDDVMNVAEAVSTVEPIDMALPAISKKRVRRVREQMGTPGDRGWAGGTFSRSIFSGMG